MAVTDCRGKKGIYANGTRISKELFGLASVVAARSLVFRLAEARVTREMFGEMPAQMVKLRFNPG